MSSKLLIFTFKSKITYLGVSFLQQVTQNKAAYILFEEEKKNIYQSWSRIKVKFFPRIEKKLLILPL